MRVLFRADASAAIGSGHVARCLTLAAVLRASGKGIEAPLPWLADIDALEHCLAGEAEFDWIVVDHYGLDHRWQTAARRWARRLAAIDDLNNRQHAVDLLFDQNFTAGDPEYAGRALGPCRQLLGPRYALIRGADLRQGFCRTDGRG